MKGQLSVNRLGSIGLVALSLCQFALSPGPSVAQQPDPAPLKGAPGGSPLPDGAPKTIEEWKQKLASAKRLQPANSTEYLEMQRLIRDASKAIMDLITDKKGPQFKEVELDYLSSAVMLIGNDQELSSKGIYEKIRGYLEEKEKEKIAFNDVQIALMICQRLELEDRDFAKEAYEAFATFLEKLEEESLAEVIPLFRASIRRLDLPGQKLELTGTTVQGESFTLEQFKGKFVLVHIWATWSPPCVQEFSHVRKLVNVFKKKGLEIVSISLDEKKDSLVPFLSKSNVTWPVLWDESTPKSHPFAVENGIASLPTMIVLDRDGKVLSVDVSSHALALTLDKIFNPPTTLESDPGSKEAAKK